MKGYLLKALGLVLSVLPPTLATLSYFPIWIAEGGEFVASGLSLLLLLVSFLPLWNLIKRLLASPSVFTVWLIAFIAFFALSRIADEMTVISFIGFIGNLLGAICYRAAKRYTR